jgi:hypothetical protein
LSFSIKTSLLSEAIALLLLSGAVAGCESTDSETTVTGGAYYGTSFDDPWYYGDYDYPPDVIVTPPQDRPNPPPHPAHPINLPSGPTVSPLPSIPSTPRPAFRR